MKTYIFYRETNGHKEYLAADDTFTRDRSKAKEYKGQFWIELLKVLIRLISIFGYKLKMTKK